MTQHPDEGTLHAYIDGELPSAEAEALEAHVAGCASCAAALAEARGLVAATSQVITALDAAPATMRPAVPAVPVERRPSTTFTTGASRPLIFRMPYARAAALLLLVGGSAIVADRSGVFDGSARSPRVSTTADAVQQSEPSSAAAPEAMASSAVSAPVSPAPADFSGATVGGASGAIAPKAAPAPRRATNGPAHDGAREVANQRATATRETAPAISQQDVAAGAALKRDESAERARASTPTAAPAAPPTAPPPARAVVRLSEVVVTTDESSPVARVSRYRTRDGTILTLTEEALRTSFAEESDARRTAAPTAAGAQRPAAAAASPPGVNSYRWSRPDQGRTYTLTGSLPVAELEALSKRLSELERLP